MSAIGEPLAATETLPAVVEIFDGNSPHINFTQALADAVADDGTQLDWVMDLGCTRVKLWVKRPGEDTTACTVELQFMDLLTKMGELALARLDAATETEKP